jgi:transposase
VHNLQELKRQGLSITQIAAVTGFNRRTIRNSLADPVAPRYGPRAPRPTKLDPFHPYLTQRLAAGVWNAKVLLREITERGYTGGYTALKDYLQPRRREAAVLAVRRFETPPGHQAQMDWGHLGAVEGHSDRGRQKLYGFVLTLGYSRAMYADLATDQTLPTLLRLHEAAFEALGGLPREILYDWMKTVALGTDERGEVQWHPQFLDFARYWGFTPRLCRPYRAQTKGKIESGVGYVRNNFLAGCQPDNLVGTRGQLFAWTARVAHQRVHGTTHRVVAEAWEAEKPHLLPVAGRTPYPLVIQELRRVSRDAYVAYGSNRYAVPWRAAGREVFVRESDGWIEIVRGQEIVARHALCGGRHQVIENPAYHADIPLAGAGKRGKRQVVVQEEAPQVEERPLSVYEWLAAVAPEPGASAGGGG